MKRTHGLRKHPLYRKWVDMKHRCYNKNLSSYKWYGAIGITVCDEWRNDFKAFYDYVTKLDHYAERGMTLDRIDNDGNYEPGNVRWVDMHVQSANRNIPKNNLSGYIGVSKKRNKWRSNIGIQGKQIRIGIFDTAIEAAMARNKYIIDNNLTEYKIQKI